LPAPASAGGIAYSNDLSRWLTYRPADPAGRLAAARHVGNLNTCANASCWNSALAPVAAQVPLAAGASTPTAFGIGLRDHLRALNG
jgi:hypothetical protein